MSKLNSLSLVLLVMLSTASYAKASDGDSALTQEIENAEMPVEVLSLSRALALSLAGNPDLEEFSWDLRANEARIIQAELLPNPTLNFTLEDFAGSGTFDGTRQAQSTILVSQLIELGGKRSARGRVASSARDVANWNYRIKRTEVLTDTAIKFFHVAADAAKMELAQEAKKLASTTLHKIRARVKAGSSSSLQEHNARVVLAKVEIEQEHTEHELAAAKLRLAATWGAKKVLFDRVDANLFSHNEIPSYDELSKRLSENPEIQRWMSEQKMWKAKASLAKANRVPDVTLGLGLRRFEAPEDEALVVEMSVPIPILNRNQGKIKEIKALYQKSEAGKRSAAVRQNSMLFGLYQELSHAKIEIRKSKEEILPFAKKALKVAKDGFAKGRFSYLELSDAQRTFVEAKERYINSALEFQQLKLEIERLLGEPLQAEFKQISKQEK